MNAQKNVDVDGTGSVVFFAVFVILLVAKISGAADISWLYVTLPLWIPLAMLVAVLGFVGAFLLFTGAFLLFVGAFAVITVLLTEVAHSMLDRLKAYE